MASFDKDNDELFPELAEEAQQVYNALQYWGQLTEIKIKNPIICSLIPSIQFPIKLNDFYKALKDTPQYIPVKTELTKQIQEHTSRWWPVRLWRYFFSDITSRQKLNHYLTIMDNLLQLVEFKSMHRYDFEANTGMNKKRSILARALSNDAGNLLIQKNKIKSSYNEAMDACKKLESKVDSKKIEGEDLRAQTDSILQDFKSKQQVILNEFPSLKTQLQKEYQKALSGLREKIQTLFEKLNDNKGQQDLLLKGTSILHAVSEGVKTSKMESPSPVDNQASNLLDDLAEPPAEAVVPDLQQLFDEVYLKIQEVRDQLYKKKQEKKEKDFVDVLQEAVKFCKKKYHLFARHGHPDRNPDAVDFTAHNAWIQTARTILKDMSYEDFEDKVEKKNITFLTFLEIKKIKLRQKKMDIAILKLSKVRKPC